MMTSQVYTGSTASNRLVYRVMVYVRILQLEVFDKLRG